MNDPLTLDGAVSALAALAHGHRLSVFRLLVKAGPDGMPAGEIARQIGVPPSTLSTHLAVLDRAGLVRSLRQGRLIVYAASLEGMRGLLDYLIADCCNGRPEICDALTGFVPDEGVAE